MDLPNGLPKSFAGGPAPLTSPNGSNPLAAWVSNHYANANAPSATAQQTVAVVAVCQHFTYTFRPYCVLTFKKNVLTNAWKFCCIYKCIDKVSTHYLHFPSVFYIHIQQVAIIITRVLLALTCT